MLIGSRVRLDKCQIVVLDEADKLLEDPSHWQLRPDPQERERDPKFVSFEQQLNEIFSVNLEYLIFFLRVL